MISIYLLRLLNIIAISIFYKKQQKKLSLRSEFTRSEKKKIQKKKCSSKRTSCCLAEVKNLLEDLRKKDCEIKLLLTTGTAYYNLKGWISDIRKNGHLLVLINSETNASWFIPIDKIAAIYT